MSERIQGGRKIAGGNFSNKETWDPTKGPSIKGKDGKDYPTPAKNPEPGKEPYKGGYYMGVRSVQTQHGPQSIHEFKGKDGKEWQIWGTTVLNDALGKIANEFGFGKYCEVQWNGKKVRKHAQNKPEELLEKTDFFQSYEVIVDENDPGLKVNAVVAMPAAPAAVEAPFESGGNAIGTLDGGDDLPY